MKFSRRMAAPLRLMGAFLALSPVIGLQAQETLSAGAEHVLIIGENNTLWGWGANDAGQVGIGGTTDQLIPVLLSETNDWRYVAAGGKHSLAIKTDGTLWAWGSNSEGQLGINDNTVTSVDTPTRIGSRADWIAISAGYNHSLALRADNTLWAWGAGGLGQIGDGLRANVLAPKQIGTRTYRRIDAGIQHNLAIATDGILYSWGHNANGRTGQGITIGTTLQPSAVSTTVTSWQRISATGTFSLAVTSSGKLYAWGSDSHGQLGLGDVLPPFTTPQQVGSSTDWVLSGGGLYHSMAIRSDGTLWGFGQNAVGQLGAIIDDPATPARDDPDVPVQIGTGSQWESVSAGSYFTVVRRDDGLIVTSGANGRGQLGNGTTDNSSELINSFFGIPDLVVSNVVPTNEVTAAGQSLGVNIFIRNVGSAGVDAGSGAALEVYLSRDETLEAEEDVRLNPVGGGAITVSAAIPSGLAVSVPVTLALPASVDSGDYFLIVVADSEDSVNETQEDNNEGVSTDTIAFTADLTVSIDEAAINALGEVQAGSTIPVNLTLANGGSGNVAAGVDGTFQVRVILSSDAIFGNQGDIELIAGEDLEITSGIVSGGTLQVNRNIAIPRFLSIGDYFIFAEADATDAISEIDEGNNVTSPAFPAPNAPVAPLSVGGILLAEALLDTGDGTYEGEELTFSSGGDGSWFGQSLRVATNDDRPTGSTDDLTGNDDAAESPPLTAGEQSYIEVIIPGPSRITYYWSVNSGSEDNYLKFTVDGAEPEDNGRISGQQGFEKNSHILPALENKVRWTFVQGAEPAGEEYGLVDFVQIDPVEGPDLIVESLTFEPGTYVPGFDQIAVTILGRNQGEPIENLPGNLEVSVSLSLDRTLGNADDVDLGLLDRISELDPNDRFVYAASRPIPGRVNLDLNGDGDRTDPGEQNLIIPAGEYYLIAQVDSSDIVDEFDEDNNIRISEAPSVVVDPRPDIVPTSISFNPFFPSQSSDAEKGIFLPNEFLDVDVTLRNNGLGDVPAEPFSVNVVMSTDRVFDQNDFVLASVPDPSGLPVGQTRTYRQSIEILPGAPLGRYHYVGVIVDANGSVAESGETNNTLGTTDRILISETTLNEAIDDEPQDEGDTDFVPLEITNTLSSPWFGQRSITFDGEDAAQASPVAAEGSAGFGFTLDVPIGEPTVVSFAWKVSSELDLLTFKQDPLVFLINGVEQDRIAGERDWAVESFSLEPGTYELRWEYRKDLTISSGLDTGWVDRVRLSAPDLTAEDLIFVEAQPDGLLLEVPPPDTLISGLSVVDLLVTFANSGETNLDGSEPFAVEVFASPTPAYDPGTAISLDSFTFTQPLVRDSGDPQNPNPLSSATRRRTFPIPDIFQSSANYYIGFRVDAGGDVGELNEDNNVFPGSTPILIQPQRPDLAVSVAAITGDVDGDPDGPTPVLASPSGPLQFSLEVANTDAGTTDIVDGPDESFVVDVYLSRDRNPGSQGSILIASRSVTEGIPSGSSILEAFNLTLDETIPDGDFYLVAVVDAETQIIEIDETNNNTATATAKIAVRGLSLYDAVIDPPNDVTAPTDAIDLVTAGDGGWFGVADPAAIDGDFAQSPPLEGDSVSAYIETTIPGGPFLLEYRARAETSRSDNYFTFSVDGEEEGERIFGSTQWADQVQFLPSPNFNKVRWTFVQTAEVVPDEGGLPDRVFLDNVRVTPIDEPDLIVESVQFNSGVLVPTEDELSVVLLGRNQGSAFDLDSVDFRVTAYLSTDDELSADDYPIADLNRFSGVDPDNRFGYSASTIIPADVPGGSYYLLAVVDSVGVVDGSDPDGAIPEFTDVARGIDGEANNTFASDAASVVINPLPDLLATDLDITLDFPTPIDDPEPALVLIGDVIEVVFTVTNQGLADVPADDFEIAVVASEDRVFDPESTADYVLVRLPETRGLPVGQSRTYRIPIEIRPDVPLGTFNFIGVVTDATGLIEESRESNNAIGSTNADVVFSEFTVAQSIGSVAAGFGVDVRNDIEGFKPFFGQSAETFDFEAAAQATAIGGGETAAFEFDVDNPPGQTSIVSFWWRTSSERSFVSVSDGVEVLKEDALVLLLDGIEIDRISGIEDWELITIEVPDGEHTIRWEYRKDFTVSDGLDTAWVDFVQTTSPNLVFTDVDDDPATPGVDESAPAIGLSPTSPTVFTRGDGVADEFDVVLTIGNDGLADVRTAPPITVQIRMSPDPQWDEDGASLRNDFILDTFTLDEVVPAGDAVTITRTVALPETIAFADDFLLAARVDYLGVLAESIETDNEAFTADTALRVELQAGLSLAEALNFAAPFGWETEGDAPWFGQGNVDNDEATTVFQASAQSAEIDPGEQSTLTTQIDGPGVVSFHWLVDSIENFDVLRFSISGLEKKRISGDQKSAGAPDGGWIAEQFFVPAGRQKLSWTYSKTSSLTAAEVEDSAWVDRVAFEPVTLPDLTISSIATVAGDYIVDRRDQADGDKIPFTIVAKNQGADAGGLGSFEPSDISVRLSADRVWGNDDDIIFSDFGRLEFIAGSDQVVVEGEARLPLDAPAGSYYIAAYIDFTDEILEYPESNQTVIPTPVPFSGDDNNLGFTGSRAITVQRLPDLVIDQFSMDGARFYYPEGSLRFSIDLRNRGLEATDGTIPFTQQIRLFAIDPLAVAGLNVGGVTNNDVLVAELINNSAGVVDTRPTADQRQLFLPGISEINADGGVVTINFDYILPTTAEIEIGIDQTRQTPINQVVYFFVLNVDLNDSVAESDEINSFVPLTFFRILPYPGSNEQFSTWANRYGIGSSQQNNDPDGDGLTNLQEYAFDLNPLRAETNAQATLSDFRIERVGGEDYLAVGLNLNIFANDLRYDIEVSSDNVFFTPTVTLTPPYLDDTGPGSLTGPNGLKTLPQVIGVNFRGYTARITVIDDTPVDQNTTRYMRVSITEE